MAKKLVVLAVHGMGDTKMDFADDLQLGLSKRLGDSEWSQVHFDTVFYQDILQDNQLRVMKAMKKKDIDWIKLRTFLLYGFSDAAGLERRANTKDSPYHETQKRIRGILAKAYDFIEGSVPVILVAQSLGGQVVSNFIWDAQQDKPAYGTWKHDEGESDPLRDAFLRLKTMKYLYTTGCNIPIFLSGFPEEEILAVKTSADGYSFRWKNYFDSDDVLGWPLKPLSKTYREAVYRDFPINAAGSLIGMIGQGWNPFSHVAYWKDKEMLKPLVRDIRSLMS